MLYTHRRAAWVPPGPLVSGPAFNWNSIEWIVLHYTAASDLPDGDFGEYISDLPGYLRAVHRDYLRRGYSIGYNAAVDWLGGTWELRGDTYKCAANADREDTIESPHDKGGDENARTFAILMLVDGQNGATPLAAAAVRGLVAQIRNRAPKAVVLGHRDVDKTQCPGTGVYAQISAGVFEPVVKPPPPTPPPITEEDMILTNKLLDAIRSAPPPASIDDGTGSDWLIASLLEVQIREIQRRNNLPVTGRYDQATGNALNAELQR